MGWVTSVAGATGTVALSGPVIIDIPLVVTAADAEDAAEANGRQAKPFPAGIRADEFRVDFALRFEWPRSHGRYRAHVLLTAGVLDAAAPSDPSSFR